MSELPAKRLPRLFSLARPDSADIADALPRLAAEPLSYTDVGGTESGDRPPWWYHHEDVLLGTGQDCFERGADAVNGWVPFDLPWLALHDPDGPPRPDQLVAFSSRQFGLWALNVCRVVYVIDERDGDVWRTGFGYGTLASHAVQGEERFLVSWNRDTDEVRFEIAKFSRPQHLLVRAAGPLTWWIQTRFTHDALKRVKQEVSS